MFIFIVKIKENILNILIKSYKRFIILDFIVISLNVNFLLLKLIVFV
jgi:hypothetical protein